MPKKSPNFFFNPKKLENVKNFNLQPYFLFTFKIKLFHYFLRHIANLFSVILLSFHKVHQRWQLGRNPAPARGFCANLCYKLHSD